MKTVILFLFFLVPLYRGAYAQYYDMVASNHINTILIDFVSKFLTTKDYTSVMQYYQSTDTLWSKLEGKMDSSFTNPFIFWGNGYIPFDYHFEHEIFVDGGERLKVHFRNKRAWEKIECDIYFKNNYVSSANIKCITNMESQESYSFSCHTDSLGMLRVSTVTLKEFEENLKRILPYLQ